MNSSRLSIFIPTYKRAEYLRECLASFIKDAKKLNIPIVISSNAKCPKTRDLIKEYSKTHERIEYYENETDIGIDRNMLKVLDYIKTDYCLMLGDDDIILKNSLFILTDHISSDDYDFILLNGHFFKTKNIFDHDTTLKVNENKVETNPVDIFKKYWEHIPYGTLIINMNIAKQIDHGNYIGTSHAYNATAFEILAHKESYKKTLIVSKPTVGLRRGEKTWTKDIAEILLVHIPKWLESLPSLYDEIIVGVKKDYFSKHFPIYRLIYYFNFNDIDFSKFINLPKDISKKINFIKAIPFPIRYLICLSLIPIKFITRPFRKTN